MFTIVIGIWPHLSLSHAWYSEASNLGPSNTRYSTPIMSCILLVPCKHPPGICCTVLSTTIPFLESQPHPKRFETWIPNGQGLVPHAAPLGAASASLAPDFRANAPMKLVKSGMKSRGLPTGSIWAMPSIKVGKKRKQDSVLRWKLHHTVPPAHFHSPVSCLDDHPSNGYNPLLHGKISSRYRSFYCPQLRQEATTRTWELWWPVLLVFYRGADAHCIDTVMILQWCPHFCGIIWLGSYEGSFFRSLASHAWE